MNAAAGEHRKLAASARSRGLTCPAHRHRRRHLGEHLGVLRRQRRLGDAWREDVDADAERCELGGGDADRLVDARLRRRVDEPAGHGPQAADRRHDDDAGVLDRVLAHHLRRQLHAQDGPGEVEGDDLVGLLCGQVEERRHPTRAGVGDEVVEARDAFVELVEQRGDRRPIGDVGGQADRRSAPVTPSRTARRRRRRCRRRLRATTTTFAPDSSNRSAMARPIPLLPPVTTAHWPSSATGAPPGAASLVAHGIGWGPWPPTSAR